MVLRTCVFALPLLWAPAWPALAAEAPSPMLSPLFFDRCRRPCEYVGFSFDDDLDELREMRDHGANAVGCGSMWVPTQDPAAPYGVGVASLDGLRDTNHLGQSFTVDVPLTGLAFCTPTFVTEGSGCTLSLFALPPDQWGKTPPQPLATQAFTSVKDNQLTWLTFPELPPGSYYLEQSGLTGPGMGVWAVGRDAYPGGSGFIDRKPAADDDLELWCRTAAGDRALIPPVADHHAIRLGPGILGRLVEAGMHFDYAVGNWNNGGFPYYPEWFIERFPDMGMRDANGNPIMAGMFGQLAPWPSIDQAVIVDGTRRYLRAVVGAIRDNPNLLFWCMGGEALYPTYGSGLWTDYAPDAVAHYRAWLRLRYRDVAALNVAWGRGYASFDEVSPPNPPGRDLPTLEWLRYRNAAMAERFQYHFAEIKAADPSRPVVTCNHGDLFRGRLGTELGQDMNLYAAVSDGWEMGQIMSDEDSDLYNLMWMRAAGTFGKPLCPVRLAYKKTNPKARGGGTSYTPEAARRYFWESVGTGAWHMGFIQWRGDLPDGEWGVKGTPAQEEIKRLFAEWHRVEPYFDDTWPVKEKVGLYLAQAAWTLDGFSPLWTRLHREFTQRQIGYRILCDEQILSGELSDCALIVSGDNRVMSSECTAALRRFAASGGTLALVGPNAEEDENLTRRAADPFAGVGESVVRLPADSPTLADQLERLIDARDARYVRVEATSDQAYVERRAETPVGGHDTPFDLAGHRSVGQTFVTAVDGLAAVAVWNPTYTKKVADHSLTLEVLAGGPGGRVVGRRTFPPDELTDNAKHEVPVDPPAPAGSYYLRLLPSADLPPQLLGVWGKRDDTYLQGARCVDDAPADGDLELQLVYRVPRPARAAIEAFTLSDGLNAIVILANLAGFDIKAQLHVTPDLLPSSLPQARLTDLASGTDLGLAPRESVRPQLTIPAHRSAVVFLGAEADQTVRDRLAQLETRLAQLPAEATGPHRAHLGRAREAFAAGRYAKALASVMRAEARVPVVLTADLRNAKTLDIRAECVGASPPDAPRELQARFVPLPGKAVHLPRADRAGLYTASVPLSDLGVRYDYASRSYVPYFGALEVIATGTFGNCALAASCVVVVPPPA